MNVIACLLRYNVCIFMKLQLEFTIKQHFANAGLRKLKEGKKLKVPKVISFYIS